LKFIHYYLNLYEGDADKIIKEIGEEDIVFEEVKDLIK
jgi:hypothetical protein